MTPRRSRPTLTSTANSTGNRPTGPKRARLLQGSATLGVVRRVRDQAWNRVKIGFRNVPGSADETLGLTKSALKERILPRRVTGLLYSRNFRSSVSIE